MSYDWAEKCNVKNEFHRSKNESLRKNRMEVNTKMTDRFFNGIRIE